MLALLLALAQTNPDPAKWTAATENGMTACRARAGWHSIFDGLAADAWKASAGTATASSGWLTVTPMQDAELAYPRALGDFELEACYADESGFPNRLYVRVRDGRVGVNDGKNVFVLEPVAVGARSAPAPVVVERVDASDTPWRLKLAITKASRAFTGVVLREEWAMPGSRVALVGQELAPRTVDGVKHTLEAGELRVTSSEEGRLDLGPTVGDFVLDFEARSEDASACKLWVGGGPIAQWNGGGRSQFLSLLGVDADWRRVRVECVGPALRAWSDDRLVIDELRTEIDPGPLALDFHRAGDVTLRNLALRDLGTPDRSPLAMGPAHGRDPLPFFWRTSLETWADFSIRVSVPDDLDELVLIVHAPFDGPDAEAVRGLLESGGSSSSDAGMGFSVRRKADGKAPRRFDVAIDGGACTATRDGRLFVSHGPAGTCRGMGVAYDRGRVLLVSSQRDALARVQVSVLEGSTH